VGFAASPNSGGKDVAAHVIAGSRVAATQRSVNQFANLRTIVNVAG
jgi:hypothetical protein